MAQSQAQKAKAQKLSAEKKVRDAAKKVKQAREAAKDLEITSVDEWMEPEEERGVKLMLPSGKVCLAINPGMDAFLEQGMIPNALLPIVHAAINEGKGLPPKEVEAIASDPERLSEIMLFANRVTVHSVLKPPVQMPPVWTDHDAEEGKCRKEEVGGSCKEKRQPGILYVDMVTIEDRMFILQWAVGGTRDLERFRLQSPDDVEGASAGEVDTEPTE